MGEIGNRVNWYFHVESLWRGELLDLQGSRGLEKMPQLVKVGIKDHEFLWGGLYEWCVLIQG